MTLTASALRQDIYRLLDEIAESGKPLEINRKGTILRIAPVGHTFDKLKKLKKRQLTNEDSNNFVHLDWSHEWGEGKKL